MKRNRLMILLLIVLLLGCTVSEAPEVHTDPRAEAVSPVAEQKDPEAEAPAAASTEAPETRADEPEAADFAHRVAAAWEDAGYLDGMQMYAEADVLDYYGIDLSSCKSGIACYDTSSYVLEAVLLEADEATAAELETLLTEHLTALKAQFRSYDAGALAMAEKAVLWREDGIVLLIISPDADAMQAMCRELMP